MRPSLRTVALEVGAQAVAEHRDVELVGDRGELEDLLAVRNCASSTRTQWSLRRFSSSPTSVEQVDVVVIVFGRRREPIRESIMPEPERSSKAAVHSIVSMPRSR